MRSEERVMSVFFLPLLLDLCSQQKPVSLQLFTLPAHTRSTCACRAPSRAWPRAESLGRG